MADHPIPPPRGLDNPPPPSDFRNPTEDEPLLPTSLPSITKSPPARWQAQSRWGVISMIYVIIIAITFGGKLTVVPSTRIFEWILCHYHYNELEGDAHIGFDEDLPESMCKGEEVQEKLNVLLAGLWMIGCVPALATTVAYGSLADRIGRRPIFALAMSGLILAVLFNLAVMAGWKVIPLQLIWISPIFYFVGGGEAVANMMFYTMANDVVPEEHRATVFLLGSAGAVFADMTAPSLSSFLMLKSPWIPMLLGTGILILGTCLVFCIPETLHMIATNSEGATPDSASQQNQTPKYDDTTFITAARSRVAGLWKRFHNFTQIFRSLPTILLLISFLVGPFGRVGGDMLLRYVSNRYHWSLREVGFLLSLQGFINLLLIVVILPATSYILIAYFTYTNKAKDLLLAKFSAVMLTAGALILAAAPTVTWGILGLTIWTIGTGFPPIARSLITTQVDPQHIGQLFSAIAMIELVCYMAANPLQATLYHLGLKWRGPWEGLPYYSLGLVCSVAATCVFVFGWLKREEMHEAPIRLAGDNIVRDVAGCDSDDETVVGSSFV